MGGWKSLPGFPYYNQQGIGAWLTLGILIIWVSRKHLKTVFTTALKPSDKGSATFRKEPFQYRTALLGILIGIAILVFIFQQAGMSVGILLAFLFLYFLMSIAITYARAAVGVPYHEVIYTHPQLMLVSVLGVRRIGAANLTLFSFLYPYVRDNVSHPMPSQLEGFQNSGTCASFTEEDGDCYDSRSVGSHACLVLGVFASHISTRCGSNRGIHYRYRY